MTTHSNPSKTAGASAGESATSTPATVPTGSATQTSESARPATPQEIVEAMVAESHGLGMEGGEVPASEEGGASGAEGTGDESETQPPEAAPETPENPAEAAPAVDPNAPKPETVESLQAKLKETQAQLAKAQRPVLQPSARDPLSNIFSPEGLQQAQTDAQRVLEFCEMNPDGATVPNAKGEDVTFSPEQIRAKKVEAQRVLAAIPRREGFLKQHAALEAEAQQAYPELSQEGTPAFQRALQAIQVVPELLHIPNLSLTIGDALVGEEIRMAAAVYVKAQKDAGKTVTYRDAFNLIKTKVFDQLKAPATAASGPVPGNLPVPPKPGEAKPVPPPRGMAPKNAAPGRTASPPAVSKARDNLANGSATRADAIALLAAALPD